MIISPPPSIAEETSGEEGKNRYLDISPLLTSNPTIGADLSVTSTRKEEGDVSGFVVMPIPISNPTIGTGLGAIAMYLYKVDEKAPTSNTSGWGFYTNSDSWMAGVRQTTYLKEDRWRINATLGYFQFKYDFFGIGNEAGDRGIGIPITQKGLFFSPDVFKEIGKNLYAGVRYRLLPVKTSLNLNNVGIDIPIDQIDIVSSGLGIIIDYDNRDNHFYPFRGTFLDVTSNFASDAFGSDFDYQKFEVFYNYFTSLAGDKVLAFRATGCYASSDTPFFDLCLFGSKNDLRGYVTGQYRDKTMLSGQVEYRWRFYKKFGMVAFAGVGEVAPSLGDYTSGNLLPGEGVGLRYVAAKKQRVNVSIDYAVGKDTDGFYFRIGEAF